MTGLWTIARLEIARRWALWFIVAGAGLLARVLPVLSSDERLAEVCTVGLVVLSWVIAFTVGMSLLGRPLHDGRLAFFFTRPIPGLVIAAGKLAGGLVLVLVMEALVLIPVVTSDMGTSGVDAPVFVVGITLVFLAAGLVVGILARSRSRWFLVDAVGAAVVALLALAVFGEVNRVERRAVALEWTPEQAMPMFARVDLLLRGLAITAILVVFATVSIAIAVGRTDRDRVHRSLAITLWSTLAVTGVVGAAFAHWGLV